jgi:hypothetical protein
MKDVLARIPCSVVFFPWKKELTLDKYTNQIRSIVGEA